MKTKIIFLITILFLNAIKIFSQDASQSISVNVNGREVKGTYSVWYGDNNSEQEIIKPFIICEGFDPLSNYDGKFSFDQVDDEHDFLSTDLWSRNYDVIVLDLKNNTNEIEKNAELFIAFINSINSQLLNNNSKYRLNVLGISMGGLVVRYALAKMEKEGTDHRVQNYISFDSPHLGANIPLGIQHMVDTYLGTFIDIAEWTSVLNNLKMTDLTFQIADFSTELFGCNVVDFMSDQINKLDYSAAFQMSAVYMHQNTWRQAYLSNLSSVGYFPEKCRSIALSFGANTSGQGYSGGTSLLSYNNSFKLVDYSLDLPWGLPSVGFKWTPLAINNSVYSMPGSGSKTFNASFTIQPFINMPKVGASVSKYNYQHDNLVAPQNCNIDNVPGSYLYLPIGGISDWLNGTVTIPINLSYNACIWIPFVGKVCKTVGVKFDVSFRRSDILGTFSNGTGFNDPRFCFVPTLSALAINNSNWFADLSSYGHYPNNKNITPFDAVCFSDDNYYHAWMPSDNALYDFLVEEVNPDHLYVQNKTFNNSYSNVFEANDITIGNNVDPVANRNQTGDVTTDATCNIGFRVPEDGTITLKPGTSIKGNVNFYTDPDYSTGVALKSASTSKLSSFLASKSSTPISSLKSANESSMSNIEEYSSVTITDDSNLKSANTFSFNSDFQISETKIDIYPNPMINNGNVYMELSSTTMVHVDILSIQGSIIKNIIHKEYQQGIYNENLNVSDLQKGMYMCRIQYNIEQKLIKLIVK